MDLQQTIKSRFNIIYKNLLKEGVFKNNSDLALKLGYSPQKLNEILKGRTKFNLDFIQNFCKLFNISLDYLVFGFEKNNTQISLIDTNRLENSQSYNVRQNEIKLSKFSLKTDDLNENQLIPLYDIKAKAGLIPLFSDQAHNNPIDYIHIPNLPKSDGAIYVTGDSMYPILKSGDIVVYKKIEDIANDIFWGQMYILSIDISGDDITTIKYIQKSNKKGFIKLVSYNKHHQDKDVQINKIRALGLIKASIRLN